MSAPTGPGAGPILALDASTLRAGVALLGPAGERWGAWQQEAATRGTAALAPAIAQLLAARRLEVADLLGVAVGTGPGSYTGIRSAIALARAMCFASGRPLVGVPSVRAAAAGLLAARPDVARVILLVDARRAECYRADYERRPDAPDGLAERRAPCLVSGAQADPAPEDSVLVVREALPDPYDVAAVGRAQLLSGGVDPATVLPLYLKRSHAEIVFDERVGPGGRGER